MTVQMKGRGLARHFWQIAGAVSVRMKIMGIVLGLVLLLGVGITQVVRQSLVQVMELELELRAISAANDLASRSTDVILINNLYALYQLINETQANYPDIRYVFVVDQTGQVLAHTFGSGFPIDLIAANSVSPQAGTHVTILETSDGKVWDAAAPIFDGRAGVARIGFSEEPLRRTVGTATTQLLLATLLVSAAGIAAALFLTWILTRPILELTGAAQAIGHGDLDQMVTRWANDEIGDLADAFNTMVEELKQAEVVRLERVRLRAELIERVIAAQEDERQRIARDLHDQTSQSLVSLIVQLKLVESADDEQVRAENLAALREQLRSALADVRRMALDLRPGVLDDLGLVEAIHWFADRCCQDGLQINIDTLGDLEHLPSKTTVAVYRVVQEALSNIVKHSGARNALIDIEIDGALLKLEIVDDGRGFNPGQVQNRGGAMGLFSMQERVELLGGTFQIDSQPGRGTCIRASLPVRVEPAMAETPLETVE